MTEKEKMLSGKLYDTSDAELSRLHTRAHLLCKRYSDLPVTQTAERSEILRELLHAGENAYFQGPISFDYGVFTTVGKNFYANFNFTALDCCPITIGDNVMCGPNVSLLTPMHPLLPEDRNVRFRADGTPYDLEYAKPITIGDNCWLAGNVTVLGGVTIGEGCVIGAGSVVTRDIPPRSLAFGVPCRVVRSLDERDALRNHPELF